jgi:ribosome-binding protein aMBF1 (putative translation factor)
MQMIGKKTMVFTPNSLVMGKAAKKQREDAGISLREMAKRMGYSAFYLYDLERGHRGWSEKLVEKFNKALK